MADNFNMLNELLNELANVDTNLSDEDLQGFVIDALPSSWKMFGAVLCGHENQLTFAQLENFLREEDLA